MMHPPFNVDIERQAVGQHETAELKEQNEVRKSWAASVM